MRYSIFYLAALVLLSDAQAQDAATLNQRLGGCDAQKRLDARAKCFEQLARDAIGRIEQLSPAVPTARVMESAAPPQPPTIELSLNGDITTVRPEPSTRR
jgi:hypothetical protein